MDLLNMMKTKDLHDPNSNENEQNGKVEERV
jgi:hypothetical protein